MDDFVTSDGVVFGRFTRSPNQQFLLVWKDEWQCGGQKKKGPIYLFKNGVELFKTRVQRPNDCEVANNGSFVVCDWLFTEKLESVFHAFSSVGDVLVQKRFRANLNSAAISDDGSYAVCHTAESDGRHSELCSLYDLNQREEVWHTYLPFWPDAYAFSIPAMELTISTNRSLYKRCVMSLKPEAES
jgi:hypothetical protein